jgi:hypothetical protein
VLKAPTLTHVQDIFLENRDKGNRRFACSPLNKNAIKKCTCLRALTGFTSRQIHPIITYDKKQRPQLHPFTFHRSEGALYSTRHAQPLPSWPLPVPTSNTSISAIDTKNSPLLAKGCEDGLPNCYSWCAYTILGIVSWFHFMGAEFQPRGIRHPAQCEIEIEVASRCHAISDHK